MKALVLVLAIMFSNLSFASLFVNDEIYNLAEVLNSARFDYPHGLKVSLSEKLNVEKIFAHQFEKLPCVEISEVSNDEVLAIFEQAISNHEMAYADEEFDMEHAYSELASELNKSPVLLKCLDESGLSRYYNSDSGEFIASMKLL